MECSDARKQIVPFIKKQLSIDDTYRFINHINGCSECMDELEIYYILEHGLSDDYDDEISFDFKEMLNKQLSEEKSEIESDRLMMSYSRLVYAIASVVVFLALGWFMFRYVI